MWGRCVSRNQEKIRAISQECSREEISLNLILSSGYIWITAPTSWFFCCPWLRGSISWKNALALLQVGRVRRALHRSSCTTHKARPRYSKGLSGSYAKIPGSGSISLKSSARWNRLQRPVSPNGVCCLTFTLLQKGLSVWSDLLTPLQSMSEMSFHSLYQLVKNGIPIHGSWMTMEQFQVYKGQVCTARPESSTKHHLSIIFPSVWWFDGRPYIWWLLISIIINLTSGAVATATKLQARCRKGQRKPLHFLRSCLGFSAPEVSEIIQGLASKWKYDKFIS